MAAALRASADRAHAVRTGFLMGVGRQGEQPEIDEKAVQAHLRRVADRRKSSDSPVRYRAMGVQVIDGGGHFVDPHTFVSGAHTIKARRFVVATPSRPLIPDIPGLETVPYATAETILSLPAIPRHLLVLGAGPEALWVAQAYRRLGARVTLFAPEDALLPDEDPEMAAIVQRCLREEGVHFELGSEIVAVTQNDDGSVAVQKADGSPSIEGSHLLVASGRIPDLDGLDLKAARIRTAPTGIVVDHHLRSSNGKVYAIGHSVQSSAHEASIAFRNAVLRFPTRLDRTRIPRLVDCRPELASVGLTEEQARTRFSAIRVLRAPFSDNARANAEDATHGHVKAITSPDGRILGCSIVGHRAHDLIVPWGLAMAKGLRASDLAEVVPRGAVYSEVIGEAALESVKMSAQSPWLRRALGFIRRWG